MIEAIQQVLSILTPALGILLLGASIASFISRLRFLREAVMTEGKVIEFEEAMGKSGTVYCPIFTFRDEAGAEHTVKSSNYSRPKSHAVGDSIKVFYRKDRPEEAEEEGFFSLWAVPLVCGIVGTGFLIIGVVLNVAEVPK